MQRILLMMSDTGGGHRASAQALKAGYEELYPGRFQIDIVDVITDYLPYPLNQIPKTYPFLSNDAPWMWKLLYGSQDPLSFGNGLMVTGSWLAQNGVRRLFTEKRPDLIVSVHPLFQLVSKWVMDKMQWRAPFVTVVTDLTTGHPRWFDPSVDACYVPSQITYDLARRAGPAPRPALPLWPAHPPGFCPRAPHQTGSAPLAAHGCRAACGAADRRGRRRRPGRGDRGAVGAAAQRRAAAPPARSSSSVAATRHCRNGCRRAPGRSPSRSTVLSTICPTGWPPATASSPRPAPARLPRR
jgi:hypothetical protein